MSTFERVESVLRFGRMSTSLKSSLTSVSMRIALFPFALQNGDKKRRARSGRGVWRLYVHRRFRQGSSQRRRELHETAQRIDETHLVDRARMGFEEQRARDDEGEAHRPRNGDVQTIA